MVTLLCIAYAAVLVLLGAYGVHRFALVAACWRHGRRLLGVAAHAGPARADDELPHVTVQLPIFNESTVAARLVRRVAALDYPRDRLEIQVL
ncbi:MAG: glycosyltransferase, partial [Polyangiaceae bacterium]|nr:glycosyltransferase [Polyangiaceae bacterium]